MLRVERLSGPGEMQALAPEWEALDASLFPRTPFSGPLWNLLWWKHFSEDRFWVRDSFYVHTIRDSQGELIAVAPLMLTRRPAFASFGMRTLQFFGADPNVTEIRGPVCCADREDEALSALSRHLLTRSAEWDWIHWCGLRTEDPSIPAPTAHPPSDRELSNFYLPLPASWDEFRAQRSRNIKESLRKCYNSLKRDGHDFSFRVVESSGEVAAALGHFHRLHTARAMANVAVRHANVFAGARSRAFLQEYAARMAERGQLRIMQIEIAGNIVATRIGFLLGDEIYLYYSGYDEAWGKYSIMTTLLAESIKWAIERGLKVLNLSTGNDVSKTRWGPQERIFRDRVQLAPATRSAAAFSAYRGIKQGGSQGRSLASSGLGFLRRSNSGAGG